MRVICLMDSLAHIQVEKDTSFALMLEAQRRYGSCYYLQAQNIWIKDGVVFGKTQTVRLFDRKTDWFQVLHEEEIALNKFDVLLMRKDPPFNLEYIYLTYLLELANEQGLRVINHPRALRDFNEKCSILQFQDCCPPTLVACNMEKIKEFIFEQNEVVIKPLDSMGGAGIFRVACRDPNLSTILEMMTQRGARMVMAQQFLPAITAGDKRIILIAGQPIAHALVRVPAPGDFRGNMAAGASTHGAPLTARDRELCQKIGPKLLTQGLWFVGLDVIGDYVTEINVTSPTGVRQLDKAFDLNICAEFYRALEN